MQTKFTDEEMSDVLSEVSRCMHMHNLHGDKNKVGYLEEIQDMIEGLKEGRKATRQPLSSDRMSRWGSNK